MARIFTTPDAERTAKAWLHDLTLLGGIRTTNQRTGGVIPNLPNWFLTEAQKVCNELINRDFENVDQAIRNVSRLRSCTQLDGNGPYKLLKPEACAKAIVYMAELLGLYWDDSIRTPYEIDEFKKTILGAAVYKYGRNIEAVASKATKKTRKASSGSASASNSGSAGGSKSSNGPFVGPQSENVRDLRMHDGSIAAAGTPGEKVFASTEFIYRIIGDDSKSGNVPNAFIKPLNANGAAGNTNKVNFSSGRGYGDCTCFFEDPADAQDFLNQLNSKYSFPSNISNVRVVKAKADKNGYFLVGTEFGICAIQAKKLNEALTEAKSTVVECGGWEKATEGYNKKELDELHTWMRRG